MFFSWKLTHWWKQVIALCTLKASHMTSHRPSIWILARRSRIGASLSDRLSKLWRAPPNPVKTYNQTSLLVPVYKISQNNEKMNQNQWTEKKTARQKQAKKHIRNWPLMGYHFPRNQLLQIYITIALYSPYFLCEVTKLLHKFYTDIQKSTLVSFGTYNFNKIYYMLNIRGN